MSKDKNKTAVEYSYPDCRVSDGISAYIKACKHAGIPSGHAVRHYRETLKKGRKAVLRLIDSAEQLGSFGIRQRKDGKNSFRLSGTLGPTPTK